MLNSLPDLFIALAAFQQLHWFRGLRTVAREHKEQLRSRIAFFLD